MYDFSKKCTIEDIQKRFDNDVERFSNLDSGQSSTIDAPLALELITEAAFCSSKPINKILDIGCGAGNNTLKLLQKSPNFDCDLLDLSKPMLQRAYERVSPQTTGVVNIIQGDFRTAQLQENSYDVILAAAVFHHLREDNDWKQAFSKVFRLLKTGGSVWITDLVTQESEPVFEMMWNKYGQYLTELGGQQYQKKVFDYIDFEDSPRPSYLSVGTTKKSGIHSY